MSTPTLKKRFIPKGVRKGGTRFPRLPLEQALKYSRKLVGKTHVNALTQDVLFAGVFNSSSTAAEIRASALKQYGLLEGDQKTGFTATALAKSIASSPDNELVPLLRQSALKPAVFADIAKPFAGDSVSKARLKQRAAELDVHPDHTTLCVDLYVATMLHAKLAHMVGELVAHVGPEAAISAEDRENSSPAVGEQEVDGSGAEADVDQGESQETNGAMGTDSLPLGDRPRAVFSVSVQLDASLDIEKLERQLALLKKYGAI